MIRPQNMVHLTGCAETVAVEAASAKARAIVAFMPFPPGRVPPTRRSRVLSFLQRRLHLTYRPAFAVRDHADLCISADEHVRTQIVVSRHDDDVRLGLPVQRQIEIAREYPPARAIVELEDVA